MLPADPRDPQTTHLPGVTHRCRYCWTQWGITRYVRRESECDLHTTRRLCRVHGGIDCFDGRDGCPGSLRRTKP